MNDDFICVCSFQQRLSQLSFKDIYIYIYIPAYTLHTKDNTISGIAVLRIYIFPTLNFCLHDGFAVCLLEM